MSVQRPTTPASGILVWSRMHRRPRAVILSVAKLKALARHHVKCGEVLCRGCDGAVPLCGGTDSTHLPLVRRARPSCSTDTTVIGGRPGQYCTMPGAQRATATVVFCCATKFCDVPSPRHWPAGGRFFLHCDASRSLWSCSCAGKTPTLTTPMAPLTRGLRPRYYRPAPCINIKWGSAGLWE